MKPALEAELTGGVIEIPAPNSAMYSSFEDDRVSKFIQACDLYDNESETWPKVREAEQKTTEKPLYEPLKAIIHEILQAFDAPSKELRWVVNTHNIRMCHIEGEQIYEERTDNGEKKEVTLKSSPDLSILGQGPHLSGSCAIPQEPNYHHCLCPVEIKPTNFNAHTTVIQAGLYARQCFIHQPHRRYVPVVVIAGSFLYLHIHDRAGVLCTHEINIHSDPVTFVRIILGASTVGDDLRSSPFDPRVRWKLEAQHPTITVHDDALGHTLEYQITGVKFSRKSIRGRGTYCVTAETTNEGKVTAVLIKDAWRSRDRAAEWKLLAKIKGLDGVGQILGYEENEYTITTFRQYIIATFCDDSTHPCDRRFSRLVLQAYGLSLRHFTSKLGLLEAFYDAVNGHKNLWMAGILHRDVSVDNVLYGLPEAGVGNRGVLIDFDMAIDVTSPRKICQSRTGTRAFQSVAVLRSVKWGALAPPQDHLDDLESFLFVFAWICIKYDDKDTSRFPEVLNRWEDADAEACANSKRAFFDEPKGFLTEYFRTPVFSKLLRSLAGFCESRYREKASIADDDGSFSPLVDVWHKDTTRVKDHNTFLAFIQEAIDAQIEEEEKCRASSGPQPPPTQTNVQVPEPSNVDTVAAVTSTSTNHTATKRPYSASDDEHESGSKRSRTSTHRRSGRLPTKK